LIQRAGRSSHRPGAPCAITCVPTHALELCEFAAARRALGDGAIEPRRPLAKPLDVLAQHVVTCALGGGFREDELLEELRSAWSYRDLTRAELSWAVSLAREGGGTLGAYEDYRRIVVREGCFVVENQRLARLHRMGIGTIASEGTLELRFLNGRRLGSVEERFVSRLRPGDRFLCAGRLLELVKTRDMTAFVRAARGRCERTPRWAGGRLPLSDDLATSLRHLLGEAAGNAAAAAAEEPELRAVAPVLAAQERLSGLPAAGEVLAEICSTREGHHLFVFPFEGRLVNEGLAALSALRLARARSATFSVAADDYGFELLCPEPFPFSELVTPGLFAEEALLEDVAASVNLGELAKRQFREIARVALLVFPNHPAGRKTGRQLQASAGLIYDVFLLHDPDNPLLEQARQEVLERHFEERRLRAALARLRGARLRLCETPRPTPLAFPLVVERLRARLSTESLVERIERMKRRYERVS
jgi:ATP-dependent Lhr-like helicase